MDAHSRLSTRPLLTSLCLVALLSVGGCSCGAASTLSGDSWAIDQAVEVEWEGDWYPASILTVEAMDERARVHYLGFDESFDETVAFARIREASGETREPGQAMAEPPEPPITVPSGCGHVRTLERPDDGYGMHGGSETRWWYACSSPPDALASSLQTLRGLESRGHRSFSFAEHGGLQILAPAPIPRLPRSEDPVAGAAPSGTRSWLEITMGHPAPPCDACPEGTTRHPHSCACIENAAPARPEHDRLE